MKRGRVHKTRKEEYNALTDTFIIIQRDIIQPEQSGLFNSQRQTSSKTWSYKPDCIHVRANLIRIPTCTHQCFRKRPGRTFFFSFSDKKNKDLSSSVCFSADAKHAENHQMQTNPAANSFIHNWKKHGSFSHESDSTCHFQTKTTSFRNVILSLHEFLYKGNMIRQTKNVLYSEIIFGQERGYTLDRWPAVHYRAACSPLDKYMHVRFNEQS